MWNKEREFSRYMMKKLKCVEMLPVRVETGTTMVGFPDIIAMHSTGDYFIELKCMQTSIYDNKWKIAWRPGQQAFARKYFVYHTNATHKYLRSRYSWTFCAMKDGVIAIRMTTYRQDSTVQKDDVNVFRFTLDMFTKLNLLEFLQTHTQVVTPILQKGMTWREYIARDIDYNLAINFEIQDVGTVYPEVDDLVVDIADKLGIIDMDALMPKSPTGSNYYLLQRRIAEHAFALRTVMKEDY